jgi:hypothetical protein
MSAKRSLLAALAVLALATPARADDQPTGDFTHAPASEQTAGSSLGIDVQYNGAVRVGQVVLRYAGPGMTQFARVPMRRKGGGWSAAVPCVAVKEGTIRYFIQGFDQHGEPVLSTGDFKHPFVVPVHAPQPGAPSQCEEEAKSGEREARSFARVWIGVAAAFDFSPLPSGNDVCTLDAQGQPANQGLYCTNPDGSDFPHDAAASGGLVPGSAGPAGGGVGGGDVRVVASLDYAINASMLAGVRVGYVAASYPGAAAGRDGKAFFAPIHLEARGTYVFGDEPLAHAGLAPFAFAALGAAEFDSSAVTQVALKGIAGTHTVVAWTFGGPFFVAAGGGGRYAFSPHAAFTAGLKLTAAFGGGGFLPTMAPEIGFQLGF